MGDARWSEAGGGVGAAVEIEDIVGEIGGDLEEKGDDDRGNSGERREPVIGDCEGAADDGADDRGGEGFGPGGEPPGVAFARHGG